MPGYAGVGQATLLRENRQVFAWRNENVTAGGIMPASLSVAFQLERVRSAHYPWGFSVEVAFGGAPGAFEVDVMVADTDNPLYFVPWRTITQVNSFNVGRVDILDSWAKYVALYMRTLGNAVALSGQITR